MLLDVESGNHATLVSRVRDARAMTPRLMSELIAGVCHRLHRLGQTDDTARLAELIRFGAFTDAAMLLVELELPLWQVRRLAYDDGEWHCALSRERELPDWLDRSAETHHPDLALAIVGALLEAQRITAVVGRTSVPSVAAPADALYERISSDNF